jgi:hypothetical protein
VARFRGWAAGPAKLRHKRKPHGLTWLPTGHFAQRIQGRGVQGHHQNAKRKSPKSKRWLSAARSETDWRRTNCLGKLSPSPHTLLDADGGRHVTVSHSRRDGGLGRSLVSCAICWTGKRRGSLRRKWSRYLTHRASKWLSMKNLSVNEDGGEAFLVLSSDTRPSTGVFDAALSSH